MFRIILVMHIFIQMIHKISINASLYVMLFKIKRSFPTDYRYIDYVMIDYQRKIYLQIKKRIAKLVNSIQV